MSPMCDQSEIDPHLPVTGYLFIYLFYLFVYLFIYSIRKNVSDADTNVLSVK